MKLRIVEKAQSREVDLPPDGELVLGRQTDDEVDAGVTPISAASAEGRVVVAWNTVPGVARRHAALHQRPDGRVEVRNESDRFTLEIAGHPPLAGAGVGRPGGPVRPAPGAVYRRGRRAGRRPGRAVVPAARVPRTAGRPRVGLERAAAADARPPPTRPVGRLAPGDGRHPPAEGRRGRRLRKRGGQGVGRDRRAEVGERVPPAERPVGRLAGGRPPRRGGWVGPAQPDRPRRVDRPAQDGLAPAVGRPGDEHVRQGDRGRPAARRVRGCHLHAVRRTPPRRAAAGRPCRSRSRPCWSI